MSVICSAPGAAPAASSGIQTRSGATGKPEHGHKLLVKGAAECLLGRSTHVSARPPRVLPPGSMCFAACGTVLHIVRVVIDSRESPGGEISPHEWCVVAQLEHSKYVGLQTGNQSDTGICIHSWMFVTGLQRAQHCGLCAGASSRWQEGALDRSSKEEVPG